MRQKHAFVKEDVEVIQRWLEFFRNIIFRSSMFLLSNECKAFIGRISLKRNLSYIMNMRNRQDFSINLFFNFATFPIFSTISAISMCASLLQMGMVQLAERGRKGRNCWNQTSTFLCPRTSTGCAWRSADCSLRPFVGNFSSLTSSMRCNKQGVRVRCPEGSSSKTHSVCRLTERLVNLGFSNLRSSRQFLWFHRRDAGSCDAHRSLTYDVPSPCFRRRLPSWLSTPPNGVPGNSVRLHVLPIFSSSKQRYKQQEERLNSANWFVQMLCWAERCATRFIRSTKSGEMAAVGNCVGFLGNALDYAPGTSEHVHNEFVFTF